MGICARIEDIPTLPCADRRLLHETSPRPGGNADTSRAGCKPAPYCLGFCGSRHIVDCLRVSLIIWTLRLERRYRRWIFRKTKQMANAAAPSVRTVLWDKYLEQSSELKVDLSRLALIGTPRPRDVALAWVGRQVAPKQSFLAIYGTYVRAAA